MCLKVLTKDIFLLCNKTVRKLSGVLTDSLSRCEMWRCPRVSKSEWNISGRLDWTGLDEWSKLVGWDVSKETN